MSSFSDPGQRFHWFVTWRCNGACPGCVFAKNVGKRKEFGTTVKTEQAVIKKIGKFHNVSIAGGEPTVHPRFWQLVEGILEKGPLKLQFVTNGLCFSGSEAAAKKWFSRLNNLVKKAGGITEVNAIMSVGDSHAKGLKGGEKEMLSRVKNVRKAVSENRASSFNFNFYAERIPGQSAGALIRKYGLPKKTPTHVWQPVPDAGTVPETVIDPKGRVFATEAALFHERKPIGNIRRDSIARLHKRRSIR